jgi:hypothetical protein
MLNTAFKKTHLTWPCQKAKEPTLMYSYSSVLQEREYYLFDIRKPNYNVQSENKIVNTFKPAVCRKCERGPRDNFRHYVKLWDTFSALARHFHDF